MIITVRVHTRTKRNAVEPIGELAYKVWITVAPEHGKANHRVIELLADWFDVAKSDITIVSGASSRSKKIEITTYP